jgi:hypothetical protein
MTFALLFLSFRVEALLDMRLIRTRWLFLWFFILSFGVEALRWTPIINETNGTIKTWFDSRHQETKENNWTSDTKHARWLIMMRMPARFGYFSSLFSHGGVFRWVWVILKIILFSWTSRIGCNQWDEMMMLPCRTQNAMQRCRTPCNILANICRKSKHFSWWKLNKRWKKYRD